MSQVRGCRGFCQARGCRGFWHLTLPHALHRDQLRFSQISQRRAALKSWPFCKQSIRNAGRKGTGTCSPWESGTAKADEIRRSCVEREGRLLARGARAKEQLARSTVSFARVIPCQWIVRCARENPNAQAGGLPTSLCKADGRAPERGCGPGSGLSTVHSSRH